MIPGDCPPCLALPQQHSPDGLLHCNGGTTLAAHTEPAPRVEGVHAAVQPCKAFQHGQRHLSLRLLQEPQQDLLAWGAGKERESSDHLALPATPLPAHQHCNGTTRLGARGARGGEKKKKKKKSALE